MQTDQFVAEFCRGLFFLKSKMTNSLQIVLGQFIDGGGGGGGGERRFRGGGGGGGEGGKAVSGLEGEQHLLADNWCRIKPV